MARWGPALERPPGEAVSASIAFSGDVAGWLCLGFSEAGILSVVGKMFGEAPARIDDDVVDSTGELVNIICGEARRALSEQGLGITAGIPQTARGAQEPPQGAPAFVPFDTPDGTLCLAVAVEGLRGEEAAVARLLLRTLPGRSLSDVPHALLRRHPLHRIAERRSSRIRVTAWDPPTSITFVRSTACLSSC